MTRLIGGLDRLIAAPNGGNCFGLAIRQRSDERLLFHD
jgi:hypothetical protein